MNHLLGLLCLCALGVLPLVGCGDNLDSNDGSGGSVTTGGAGSEPACDQPLEQHCLDSTCRTQEQAIMAAKAFDCSADSFGCVAEEGNCGNFRYVRTGCNQGEDVIQYFDVSGTLVAATECSDDCGHICPGSCCVDFGVDTVCELETERDFCEE